MISLTLSLIFTLICALWEAVNLQTTCTLAEFGRKWLEHFKAVNESEF